MVPDAASIEVKRAFDFQCIYQACLRCRQLFSTLASADEVHDKIDVTECVDDTAGIVKELLMIVKRIQRRGLSQ